MLDTIEHEEIQNKDKWIDICQTTDLVENSGICAVLPGFDNIKSENGQVALFYLPHLRQVFVLSNWDPIGRANVMYRGIIGSIKDEPVITSPLYKQHYSLHSGVCIEQADKALTVYASRFHDNTVQIIANSVSKEQA
jgi:nitrite reductase (NADH) small subunit